MTLIYLPVRDKQVQFDFDKGKAGFEVLDGVRLHGRDHNVVETDLGLDVEHEVMIEVTRADPEVSIDVQLDGKPLTRWRGPIDSLGEIEHWKLPVNTPGFFSWGAFAELTHARLELLSGKAFHLYEKKPGKEIELGEEIDLLSKVHIDRDTVQGTWEKNNEGIVSDDKMPCVIQMPLLVQGSYEATVDFVPHQIQNSISLVLPVEESHVLLQFNSHNDRIVGLNRIDNKPPPQNETRKQHDPLTIGQNHQLRVRVMTRPMKRVRIQAALGSSLLIDWVGDTSRLSTPGNLVINSSLGLRTYKTRYQINGMRFRLLNGEARLLTTDEKVD